MITCVSRDPLSFLPPPLLLLYLIAIFWLLLLFHFFCRFHVFSAIRLAIAGVQRQTLHRGFGKTKNLISNGTSSRVQNRAQRYCQTLKLEEILADTRRIGARFLSHSLSPSSLALAISPYQILRINRRFSEPFSFVPEYYRYALCIKYGYIRNLESRCVTRVIVSTRFWYFSKIYKHMANKRYNVIYGIFMELYGYSEIRRFVSEYLKGFTIFVEFFNLEFRNLSTRDTKK